MLQEIFIHSTSYANFLLVYYCENKQFALILQDS